MNNGPSETVGSRDSKGQVHGERRDNEQDRVGQGPANPRDRLVYVMPEQFAHDTAGGEIDLRQLWRIVWAGKWQIIALTFLFASASVGYAFLATEWYRAEVLLAPADQKSPPAIGGQLSGLAALAGVSIGGGDSVDALATLRSRELALEFVRDRDLIPTFFAHKWDSAAKRWKRDDPLRRPDERDAIRFFHEKVLRVSEDRRTGLITLVIEWKEPEQAAAWAMDLVERANSRLRQRALLEAETNVAFLRQELAQTNVVTLQQAIGRLLENELQKLMLARGNHEFAFRVIDAAQPPKFRSRPQRAFVVVIGTLAGGFLGFLWVFISNALRPERAPKESSHFDPENAD